MSLKSCSPASIQAFIKKQDEQVAVQWEQYISRRKLGGMRELFQTRDESHDWIKQRAPLKLVDGAWVGHIHRVSTPYGKRHVTRDAWQVLSEEYGDGNLEMHHVHLYSQLLREAGISLPQPDSADFIHPRHGMVNNLAWKAAVSQLLISLFPHDFLPEILGYNMHFELLTLETMMAAKELEELGISGYYFFLHISIDNSHSGHTAMAMNSVAKFLAHVELTEGAGVAERAWRRVQAGYCLSSALSCPEFVSPTTSSNEWNNGLAEVFKAKAQAAGNIHCPSLIKLDGQTLGQWLIPENFSSIQSQERFVAALARTKPWVRPGDSANSRLIRELSWGGKMFGSFTSAEVDLVRRWIDNLCNPSPQAYLRLFDDLPPLPPPTRGDIRIHYPLFVPGSLEGLDFIHAADYDLKISNPDARTILPKLLPFWFTHQCVLEGLVTVPSRTANQTISAVIRVLKAYNGFTSVDAGVAGMDEARRIAKVGLIEIGLHMVKHAGLPQPISLQQVLDLWPCEFSVALLHLSMRPIKNRSLLLGLASAFSALHGAVLRSKLLPLMDQEYLRSIIWTERLAFKLCAEDEKLTEQRYDEYQRGQELGTKAVAGLCRAIKLIK
ncbi:hypothetical protein DTO013E5_9704 [Penicillium roqueforti]|nr:hypothetical protein CBS147355_5233 [Penicillium roqueforti]KAI2734791.1 hypothetical protein DTO012A1_9744 [Penicillium roqueforti]KAI2736810.1 hypothetical protein DTO013F2_9917 [Penicillium roqueforti]KAI2767806.1 hypothetical protein DTO012A8_6981 [Penicillium roqueforti]KAI3062706.1 hypothetical protein CBS147339_9816 [Penicillium roqueforti]